MRRFELVKWYKDKLLQEFDKNWYDDYAPELWEDDGDYDYKDRYANDFDEFINSVKPKRSHIGDAGYDFLAIEDVVIPSLPLAIVDNLNISKKLTIENFYDDFQLAFSLTSNSLKPTIVRTGIKAKMGDDEVLKLYIRSNMPNKKCLILPQGAGIIDSNYYNNEGNEGEIFFCYYNLGFTDITLLRGDRIGQGIFQKYLITDDDSAVETRKGGLGSSGE